MAEQTGIEWCDHTFNIAWGCTKVSEGCRHCYADTLSHRYGFDVWGPGKPRRTFGPKHWAEPLRWNRRAALDGRRARVFCSSMADIFEDHPTLDQEREKLWDLINQTPHLDWLLLTKRPEHIIAMTPWGEDWPHNIWLGTSVENQRWADIRIPLLLDAPARIHFLSCEPLLGPLDLRRPWLLGQIPTGETWLAGLDWVIAGGESGAKARPVQLDWVRSLRDQCLADHVAFFFKQWGGRTPKSQGRVLDGEVWSEFPETEQFLVIG